MMKKILLIHKNDNLLAKVRDILEHHGYEVTARSAIDREVRGAIRSHAADLVICDILEDYDNGFTVLSSCRLLSPPVPVVLIASRHYDERILEAISLGMFDCLSRPIDTDHLLQTIKRAEYFFNKQREGSIASELVQRFKIEMVIHTGDFQLEAVQKVVQDILLNYTYFETDALLNIWLAIEEALQNAHEHGNLELLSEWKDESGKVEGKEVSLFEVRKRERLRDPAYAERTIRLSLASDEEWLDVRIEDDGPGFRKREVSGSVSMKIYGRGLRIIYNLMDRVSFNRKGNRIRMRKRLPQKKTA